jgi:hypothetical protein
LAQEGLGLWAQLILAYLLNELGLLCSVLGFRTPTRFHRPRIFRPVTCTLNLVSVAHLHRRQQLAGNHRTRCSILTTHTISAGPTSRISAIDSLSMKYTFTQMSQPQFGDYATHGATLGWGRTWSKEWSSSATGGLTLIEPIPDTSSSGGQRRIPATMFPTGSVSLSYAAGSSFLRKLGSEIQETTGGSPTAGGGFLPLLAGMNMPGGIAAPGSYRLTLMYNLGVFPSFVQAAGPIYTHSIMLGSMAGITDRLSAQALFNYANVALLPRMPLVRLLLLTVRQYPSTISLRPCLRPILVING